MQAAPVLALTLAQAVLLCSWPLQPLALTLQGPWTARKATEGATAVAQGVAVVGAGG